MIIHTILLMIFMAFLIRVDMARFEIDFAALGMVALNGAALNVHLGLSPLEMALGALIWTLTALVVRVICGRGGLGQGDVWLFAAIGLIAGPHMATVAAAVVFVSLSLITSWTYARARGRKMARSLCPAAIPGGLTILLILMGRLVWMQMADTDVPGALSASSDDFIVYLTLIYGPWIAGIATLCAALLIARDRRRRDRRAQHG